MLPYKWRRRGYKLRQKMKQWRRTLAFYIFDFDTRVYEINQTLEPYLRGFSFVLALTALASVIIPYGFNIEGTALQWLEWVEMGVLAGFVVQYFFRLMMTPNRLEFVRYRWMESIASAIALVFIGQLLFYFLFKLGREVDLFGFTITYAATIAVIQGYLIFFILVKSLHALPKFIARQRNTGQFLILSFAGIIGFGALMLMLPKATVAEGSMSLVNAFFTATSAICVTGLIVVDTATHFTLFGELIILTLIQLGGLGIITFATFLALFVSEGFTVGQKNILKEVVREKDIRLITTTLKRIVGLTLTVEAIGALVYYFSWSSQVLPEGERLLFSIFHAVSAFCNAGFSLFTDSLADPGNATNVPVNITTMLLIILGGLGFPTIWELLHRGKSGKKRWSVQTRIILIMTAVLLVGGTVGFWLLEQSHLLKGDSFADSLLYAAFQSVTTRTAGFNTLDIGALAPSTTLIVILLMTIGAAPASTGGGIKTTTVYVLFSSAVNTIRGRSRMEIGHRTIPEPVLRRAITSLTLAFICLTISTVLLSVVEDASLIDLIFEEISAFATVGLSRGITFDLSKWGKLIIMVSMFAGRVGSLTLAASFVAKRDNRKYRYPYESIMVS